MKVTIPSYHDLFEAATTNMLLSSVHPKRKKRIEKFLDEVVATVRSGFSPAVSEVSAPFNFSVDADIQSEVTTILNERGYKFSIDHYPSRGYEWKVELYIPKESDSKSSKLS